MRRSQNAGPFIGDGHGSGRGRGTRASFSPAALTACIGAAHEPVAVACVEVHKAVAVGEPVDRSAVSVQSRLALNVYLRLALNLNYTQLMHTDRSYLVVLVRNARPMMSGLSAPSCTGNGMDVDTGICDMQHAACGMRPHAA